MDNRGYKRKQFFIDKNFQTRFILKFCIVVIASSLLIEGIVFYLSRNSTTVTIENTKVIVKRTADFILPIMTQTLLIVTFCSVVVVLVLILFISHRIAGPLYRLRREIESLRDGDLVRNFNIRATDELKALAESLSQMSLSLKEKITSHKEKCKKLEDYLAQKDFTIVESDKHELAKILEELNSTLNSFRV